MIVIDDLDKVGLLDGPGDKSLGSVLTIGAFDGVHRGHQALIGQVVARAGATGGRSVVVTFHPHPAMVLAPDRAPRYLTTPGEKVALLEGLGVDLVVLLPFSRKMASTPAHEFMASLSNNLRFRELWVGTDFALGRGREGNVSRLRELGEDLGYEVFLFEPLQEGEEAVSSSRIRTLLAEGCVEQASHLLGRYPSLSGEVVYGAQRGHTLGFPTANLEVRPERAVPANGVYAVFAVLGSERYPAVANVGVRPSFDNGNRTVETHIFDFAQEIYGCDLVVEFVARLRDERRFEDIDDLVSQIARDSETARDILQRELREPRSKQPVARSWRRVGVPCPYRYREIEHTADRALRVWGRDLADLFAGAARGMYSLMADLDGLVATDWRRVELQAWDRETLLVDWLNELLFLTETEELLFVECIIESLQDDKLVARAGAINGQPTRAHIKAATFHNLALTQDITGWSVVLTFDV